MILIRSCFGWLECHGTSCCGRFEILKLGVCLHTHRGGTHPMRVGRGRALAVRLVTSITPVVVESVCPKLVFELNMVGMGLFYG